MTATERVVRGWNDDVVSMNDEAVYGPCFHELSFKDAINSDPPVISDYKIITYVVTDEEVKEFIRDNRLLTEADAQVEEQEARALAAGIALRRAFKKNGIKHAISFHRSIRSASRFADQQEAFTDHGIFDLPVESFHISSRKYAGERARLLSDFEKSPCGLMTNARCLTEGSQPGGKNWGGWGGMSGSESKQMPTTKSWAPMTLACFWLSSQAAVSAPGKSIPKV